MEIHQPLDQRETDPEAALGAIQRVSGLDKEIEHMRQQLGCNPHAVIAHAHDKFRGPPPLPCYSIGVDRDMAAALAVFTGVPEEIAEDLIQASCIRVKEDCFFRQAHRQFLAARLDGGPARR